MAKKNEKEKGFTTAQERGRRRINTAVGVIVAAMAVVGIVGMALKGPDSSAQAAAGSSAVQSVAGAETASTQQAAVSSQETVSETDSSAQTEVIIAQSEEKTGTEETAVTPAGGSETAASSDTASAAGTSSSSEAAELSLNADGTYTLPENGNVYASASESGQVIAQLYAGNQVAVGESAGDGWYSVTVWVGTNGSYTQQSGYMKLQ